MLSRSFFRRCQAIQASFARLCEQTTPAGKASALIDLKTNEQTEAQTEELDDLKPHPALAGAIESIYAAAPLAEPERDGLICGLKILANLFLHYIQTGQADAQPADFSRVASLILSKSHRTDPELTMFTLHAFFHQCMHSKKAFDAFLKEYSGGTLIHAIAREYADKIAQAKEKHDDTFDPAGRDFVPSIEDSRIVDFSLSIILLSVTRVLEGVEVNDDMKLHALRTTLHCLDTLSEVEPDPPMQHKMWEVVWYCCNGSLLVCGEAAKWFTYQRIEAVTKVARVALKQPHSVALELYCQCFFNVLSVLTGDRMAVALDAQRASGIVDAILLNGLVNDALRVIQSEVFTDENSTLSALRFLVNIAGSDAEVRSVHGIRTIMQAAAKAKHLDTLEQAVQVLWNVLNFPEAVTDFKEMECVTQIRRIIVRNVKNEEDGKAFAPFLRKLDALYGEHKEAIGK